MLQTESQPEASPTHPNIETHQEEPIDVEVDTEQSNDANDVNELQASANDFDNCQLNS